MHLAASALTAFYSYRAYTRLIGTFMDEQMRVVADSYAGAKPRAIAPLPSVRALDSGAFLVQLWNSDGTVLLASSWPMPVVPLQSGDAGFRTVLQAGPQGEEESWRVYTAPGDAHPAHSRVQVLQSVAFRQQRARHRAWIESLPLVLLLPLSLGVLWLIVSSASRTLRVAAREMAAQDVQRPTELPLDRVPEEFGPLVAAFNTLLARLRDALGSQRRFIQDAAHELRTPIAAIGIQVDNLRASIPPDTEAADRLAQLEAGVVRTRHMVEQLLRSSRQDMSDATPDDVPQADLAVVLRDSVGQLMPLADRRRIDVGFEGRIQDAALRRVGAPEGQLRTVFDNLIDNAVRYTPEGGVVDVRLWLDKGSPVVEVIDSGPGIAPESIGRAFDRFFRVPGAPAGGSGLGLSIAQAAARRCGLRIGLRNREDAPGLIARVDVLASGQR
nr:ATP-binding protein [Variovorax dokdonensis]